MKTLAPIVLFAALLALPACATSGYSARQVSPPRTDAARDDYAVYTAVVEHLARVFATEKLAGGAGALELLVADQTYTCRGGVYAPAGAASAAKFPRRNSRGAGIGAYLTPSFDASGARAKPEVRITPIDYLDSFDWLTKTEPAPRLAIYFSAVVYLDATRDTAVVEVMSGRTNKDLSCTTWMLERARPGTGYRYLRGYSPLLRSPNGELSRLLRSPNGELSRLLRSPNGELSKQ